MTKTQQRRALAIIQADCAIRYIYCDSADNTCAVGALALKAGISKRTLRKLGGECFGVINPRVAVKIAKAYGLQASELARVQSLNDSGDTCYARRSSITGYLLSLPLTTKTKQHKKKGK